MAGEWLPYDLALPTKPETQELVDLSGQSVEVVVYRLLQLWGWASLNSADGTARATPERLARICGGDAAFWLHVAAVGWLAFDEAAGTATIPGWDRRFSACAKARASHNDRQRRWRGANEAPERLTSASRVEDKRSSPSPSPRKSAARTGAGQAAPPPAQPAAPEPAQEPPPAPAPAEAWPVLQAAWNKGAGARWTSPTPPDKLADRLAEPGWLDKAVAAIGRLPRCRYFTEPLVLWQLVLPGFVDQILGGQFDTPKRPRGSPRFDPSAPPPPHASWSGDELARLDATRRRMADGLREGVA